MTTGNLVIGGGANDAYTMSKQWSGADGTIIGYTKRGKPVLDRKTPHDYQMAWRKSYRTMTTVQTGGTQWTGWGFGSNCISLANEPPWTSDAELALLAKLASKIKGHSFNAGVFLAEGGQALATIRNSSMNLALLVKAVAYRNPTQLLRALSNILGHRFTPKTMIQRGVLKPLDASDISGVWLAYQYAWKPLVNDIYDGCQAIGRMQNGYRGVEYSASHSIMGEYQASASPSVYDITVGFRRKVKYKYNLIEPPSEQSTWGLYDPELIAWELLPFSFVVDWFIPVGRFLEDRAFFRRLSGNWVRTDFVRRWVNSAREISELYPYIIRGTYSDDIVELIRTVGSGPLNVPYPDLKTVGTVFSKEHLQNAAALVTSLASGLRFDRHVYTE